VVWNAAFIFPYIGDNNPNWRTHIFQRGRSTTNQHKPTCYHLFMVSPRGRSIWYAWNRVCRFLSTFFRQALHSFYQRLSHQRWYLFYRWAHPLRLNNNDYLLPERNGMLFRQNMIHHKMGRDFSLSHDFPHYVLFQYFWYEWIFTYNTYLNLDVWIYIIHQDYILWKYFTWGVDN